MRSLPRLSALLASAALAGCGVLVDPDPAAPTASAATFAGDYHLHLLRGTVAPAQEVRALWGNVLADGVGQFTGTISSNENGVLSGPGPTGFIDYEVDADATFRWVAGAVDVARGGIALDGDLGVVAYEVPGLDPMIAVMGRRQGVWNLASLNGTYHFTGFAYSVGGGLNASYWGTVTFDGAGSASSLLQANIGGLVFPGSPALTYNVFADGTMTLDFGGGFTHRGGIQKNGDLIVVAGATVAGDNPAMFALVRAQPGATDATLAGPYHMVGLGFDDVANQYRSVTGSFDADGAGFAALALTENQEGVITPLAGNPTYSVAGNGTLEVVSGVETWRGGVSPGGHVAVLGGSTAPGGDQGFYLLVR
jgi:hypothetical protein